MGAVWEFGRSLPLERSQPSPFSLHPFPFVKGHTLEPGGWVLTDYLCRNHEGRFSLELKELMKAFIRQCRLLHLMVLFLKLPRSSVWHHILFLKMDQEDILLKDTMDCLDDEREAFWKGRRTLSKEHRKSRLLFFVLPSMTSRSGQITEGWWWKARKVYFRKRKKGSYLINLQYWNVTLWSSVRCPEPSLHQDNRRKGIIDNSNGEAGDLPEENI